MGQNHPWVRAGALGGNTRGVPRAEDLTQDEELSCLSFWNYLLESFSLSFPHLFQSQVNQADFIVGPRHLPTDIVEDPGAYSGTVLGDGVQGRYAWQGEGGLPCSVLVVAGVAGESPTGCCED